MTSVSKIK